MGAPLGNTNGAKQNRLWGDAIRRAVAQNDSQKLRALADKLIEKAEEGDVSALRELGDRLDGKPAQSVTLAGDQDNPLVTKIVREVRKP